MNLPDRTATYIHGTTAPEQARLAELNRLTNRSFVEFLELPPTARVLEVGSGLGLLANEVAARLPAGSVTGIEISPEQLARARPAENVKFLPGDAARLPFAAESFDVVYCRYLLEHLADPAAAVAEMFRVLRPGGSVFVQENNLLVNELWPECPRFAAVWRGLVARQERLGGDALIGKKLVPLLRQAGFAEIRPSLAPEVHAAGDATFRPWVENLIGVVAGAAVPEDDTETLAAAVAELQAFQALPDACAYFYWNRAAARKPGPVAAVAVPPVQPAEPVPADVAAAQRDDGRSACELVAAYERGIADLNAAVAGMSPEALKARPIAGAWSTLEVVCHLVDCEQFFADRLKRTLAGPRPLLLGADGSRYPGPLNYQAADLAEELELFALTRRQMARVLRSADPAAWERTAVHSETGLVTLRQLLLHAINHLQHHLRFVAAKRAVLDVG